MENRKALLAGVLEELRWLRAEGLELVAVSDSTMAELREQWGRSGSSRTAASGAANFDPSARGATAPADGRSRTLEKPAGRTSRDASREIRLDEALETDRKPAAAKTLNSMEARDESIPEPEPFALPEGTKQEQFDWLRAKVAACPVCQAHLNPGKKTVVGAGNLDADIFFCGEAPGAEEETLGEPFVGPAGQLLDKMIGAMGLSRGEVYIGNIMNWRPRTGRAYGNRPPIKQEMDFCLPNLKAQIAIVRPKILVALGATATQGLLEMEARGAMGKLRGQWKECADVPVMVTYHPSFLLHNDTMARKREVWEDLMAVMEKVGLPVSEKQRRYFRK